MKVDSQEILHNPDQEFLKVKVFLEINPQQDKVYSHRDSLKVKILQEIHHQDKVYNHKEFLTHHLSEVLQPYQQFQISQKSLGNLQNLQLLAAGFNPGDHQQVDNQLIGFQHLNLRKLQ